VIIVAARLRPAPPGLRLVFAKFRLAVPSARCLARQLAQSAAPRKALFVSTS
jgi:hypothetical protein